MAFGRVQQIFPTPLLFYGVPNPPKLNADLEALIMERRNAQPGIKRSNVGGWHSEPDLLQWAGEAGKFLGNCAAQLANDNTNEVNGQPYKHGWRVEAWANVSGRGDFNLSHVHGGAFWSGVYYVRIDEGEGGELILHDPRMPGLRMHAPALRFKDVGTEQVARVKPQPGLLVLFPSWLRHEVAPWHGDGFRISIALNLTARLR